ncbi:hypothetical protein EJ02DRAFT_301542, partial [Clathrospora elynae]
KKHILKSFEATGLSPMDPEVVLKKFRQPTPQSPEGPIPLDNINQRSINCLVDATVDPILHEAKVIKATLTSLYASKQLLEQENEGLRQALNTKNNQGKRRQPLDLQQRKEYHGGAVFYSPRKIREARLWQIIKEREEKEQQLQ